MDTNLSANTILVTGSYRGTGLIIAQALLAEGATVLVHGLAEGQAEAACQDIGGGIPVTGDITTTAGSDALLEQCQPHTIDVLVNNYGTAERSTWSDSGRDEWLLAYEKNMLSAQRMIRGLLPGMIGRGHGRIINLGTVGSTRPNAQNPGYYAAKGALATATVSLAKEVKGTGVRVNLVSPGMIATPEVIDSYMKAAARKGWGDTWEAVEAHVAKDIPIGRIVRREEVANLIVFLSSPLSDGIHGQNIRIDGGALDIVS